MTTNWEIRTARADEYAALRALTEAAYAEYAPAMGDHWDDYRRGMFDRLGGAVAERIVAVRAGALLGSVLLYPGGSSTLAPDGSVLDFAVPEIGLLSVSPERRRQGIARALTAECVRRARAAGSTVLALHTMGMMRGALALYAGMGFVRDPEHDFSPAPEVLVRAYRLALAASSSEA